MPDCANCPNAGEFMERLIRENARLDKRCKELEQERDAAVEDIIIACRGERTLCGMCGNKNCEYAGDNQTYCYKCTRYEWRGVKEKEDATD